MDNVTGQTWFEGGPEQCYYKAKEQALDECSAFQWNKTDKSCQCCGVSKLYKQGLDKMAPKNA